MKIPIKHAIDSGAWFKCETFLTSGWLSKVEYTFNFKFRALSFNKISLAEIDEPEKIQIDKGGLYVLRIEAINLNKTATTAGSVLVSITLVDQDNFIFQAISDDHLTRTSNFAKSTGLSRFIASAPDLQPKIKRDGAIAFLMPDEDTSEYYLSVINGNIVEV